MSTVIGQSKRLRASRESNPEVFQAMKLADFAAWLRSQPAERVWPHNRDIPMSEGCPIACFTDCASAENVGGMPEWGNRFIQLFDARPRPRTRMTALDVLAEVEREFPAEHQP